MIVAAAVVFPVGGWGFAERRIALYGYTREWEDGFTHGWGDGQNPARGEEGGRAKGLLPRGSCQHGDVNAVPPTENPVPNSVFGLPNSELRKFGTEFGLPKANSVRIRSTELRIRSKFGTGFSQFGPNSVPT